MKDWIPLLQELIWPIFIGLLIYLNKSWFKEILDTVKERVKVGSEFNIGPSGISVGKAPVLPDAVIGTDDIIDDGYNPESTQANIPDEPASQVIDEQLSLSHRTSFWKIKDGRVYYRIFITTHAANQELKSKIEKVVYHLHPSFKNPTRVITTHDNDFLLKTNGWGEFVTRADVYLKNDSAPIKLNRYIELKA